MLLFLLKCFCCCCYDRIWGARYFDRRRQRFDKYQKVKDMLDQEFDILNIMLGLRAFTLITKSDDIKERDRARVAARYADRYCVETSNVEEKTVDPGMEISQTEKEEMLSILLRSGPELEDPDSVEIDHELYDFLTGSSFSVTATRAELNYQLADAASLLVQRKSEMGQNPYSLNSNDANSLLM
jgi:hypothetical protein